MKINSKPLPKKQTKDYRNIIIDRLKKSKHSEDNKKSMIHSLKTQCTPNEKTQDFSERFFEDFDISCRVKYRPVDLKEQRKPIKRCLYLELREIWEKEKKNIEERSMRKRCITEDSYNKSQLSRFPKNSNQPENIESKTNSHSSCKNKRVHTSQPRT